MSVNNEDSIIETETTRKAESDIAASVKDLRSLIDHLTALSVQSDAQPKIDYPKFKATTAPLPERNQYHISELLQYHDRDFIKQAYAAILKRHPTDSEFASQTENLRSGRQGKIEIVETLMSSAEGKRLNTRVVGLKSAAHKKLSKIPVLGYFIRVLSGFIRLPILIRNQERFEIYSLGQQQRLVDYVDQANAYLLEHSSETSAVRELCEILPMLFDAVVEANGKIELIHAQIETINGELKEHLERIDIAERNHQSIIDQQQTIIDKHQAAYALQREFLIQEQAVIVDTQRMTLMDLQSQLAELAERQQEILVEFKTHQRMLESLMTRSTVSS